MARHVLATKAAVLLRKGKIGILDESVHQAGKLAHDSHEANLCGLTFRPQVLVEGSKDGVAARGANGGHV